MLSQTYVRSLNILQKSCFIVYENIADTINKCTTSDEIYFSKPNKLTSEEVDFCTGVSLILSFIKCKRTNTLYGKSC